MNNEENKEIQDDTEWLMDWMDRMDVAEASIGYNQE